MNKVFFNKGLLALTLSAGLVLTGCGGGSSSNRGGPSSGGGGTEQPMTNGFSEVEGPLDAVQQPLSEQVLAPIVAGAAGTPLEASGELRDVVHCYRRPGYLRFNSSEC